MTDKGKSLPLGAHLLELTLIAVTYFVATLVGLFFVAQPEGVAAIWPPSGVALGAVILSDRRKWPTILLAIFATNAVGNLVGGSSLAVSLAFAGANIAETFMASWILVRVCGPTITFGWVLEVVTLGGSPFLAMGQPPCWGPRCPPLPSGPHTMRLGSPGGWPMGWASSC